MPARLETAARKVQLEARLADLTKRLAQIDNALDVPRSKDWEEVATEREEDEVLENMGHSAQAELRQIRAALRRVEDGTYGTCMKCGKEIGKERLDILPYTPFCRDCAS